MTDSGRPLIYGGQFQPQERNNPRTMIANWVAPGSRVLEVFGARMTARDFKAGVEARLHHKDFGILMNEAAVLGAPLPIAAQVWQQLNALMAHGWGREDTSSLLRVLEGESR